MAIAALASTYTEARSSFLTAAEAAGARITSHPMALDGPRGEDLAIDVARLGPDDALATLLVVSGTHGVEGFAGSTCQSAWLESLSLEGPSGRSLPEGVAAVVVHAHNPYGFAWVRRVNEVNVDLNRNYGIDHRNPPANDDYDRIAEHLSPSDISPETLQVHDAALLAFGSEHGFDALQGAVSGGQYRHPDGLFYGGSEPAWSQLAMRQIVADELSSARRVVILDLHTGLGDKGALEIITTEHPDTDGYQRTRSWFGDRVGSTSGGDSVSARLDGEWMPLAGEWLAPREVTAVALEWGTVDSVEVLQALRADAWLHNHGDPTGPEAAPIKERLRAAFAPGDPEWIAGVRADFEVVVGQAIANLT